jgi:hypothetical protein
MKGTQRFVSIFVGIEFKSEETETLKQNIVDTKELENVFF